MIPLPHHYQIGQHSLMEALAADLFSEPEIEELNLIHEWELSSLDQELTSQSIWECLQETLSTESNASSSFESPRSSGSVEGPEKFLATVTSWNSSCTAPGILSFGNPGSPGDMQAQSLKKSDGGFKPTDVVNMEVAAEGGLKRAKVTRSRPIALNHEHVIAERKRREKITEKLITLSGIIPGLKKRDKASILTDTITYMKQMEEKVKTLEEQASKENKESAAVIVTKSQLSVASDESSDGLIPSDGIVPTIEARISGKNALIRIHCEGRKGFLVKALTEIENQHLTIINTSVLPFSDRFLDATVMAQVEEGFSTTVKDLLNNLNSAFRQFM